MGKIRTAKNGDRVKKRLKKGRGWKKGAAKKRGEKWFFTT
jgi:hypothetical protein